MHGPVWFANTVARALGHHFALPDEALAGIDRVEEWVAATEAASAAYTSDLPTPTAPWAFDAAACATAYTTPSGRLEVTACAEGGTLMVYAGPPAESIGRLELIYDADAGVYRVSELHNLLSTPHTISLWCGAEDRLWVVQYASRPEWPGRPILLVTYDREGGAGEWRFGVEWINAALVFAERRYDRLELLFRIDREFGGAITVADRSGQISLAAAAYAAELAVGA